MSVSEKKRRALLVSLLDTSAESIRAAIRLVADNASVTARLTALAEELEFHADAFRGHDAKA